MSRVARFVFAAVAVGATFGVFILAGCLGGAKLGAARAAAILKAREGAGTWKTVNCQPHSGTDGYWDYDCHVVSKNTGPFSFEIRVNDHAVTDQSGP
jgi:hypothetical protein